VKYGVVTGQLWLPREVAKALLQQMKDNQAGLEPSCVAILQKFITAIPNPLADLSTLSI
jgi:hypothetical protein